MAHFGAASRCARKVGTAAVGRQPFVIGQEERDPGGAAAASHQRPVPAHTLSPRQDEALDGRVAVEEGLERLPERALGGGALLGRGGEGLDDAEQGPQAQRHRRIAAQPDQAGVAPPPGVTQPGHIPVKGGGIQLRQAAARLG